MPKIGEMTPAPKQDIESGAYAMVFEHFTDPVVSKYTTKNGAPKMQVDAVYRFADTGDPYTEKYLTVSSYDGAGDFPASKMFLRLQGLTGVKDQKEADQLDLREIRNIPVIAIFAMNDRRRIAITEVKRDNSTRAKTNRPTPVQQTGDDFDL